MASVGAPKSKKALSNFKQAIQGDFERGERKESSLSESFFGSFDTREKLFLSEAKVGSGEGGAQWTITGPSLQKIRSVVDTNYYGELDLSQKNIDELTKIYIEKLGEDVMAILNATKDFTENIGTYFATEDRGKAMNANQKAQAQGKEIVDRLATAAQPDKE